MEPKPVVQLNSVTKRFEGGTIGVSSVDLSVSPGEFLTLLGPSGCGKTTMLRLIAEFEAPTSGSIFIDGADVTALPPYVRPVNTVFQDYALFPHMNVEENIGFGLSVARVGAGERRRRVKEVLALVALSEKSNPQSTHCPGGDVARGARACPGERAAGSSSRRAPRRPRCPPARADADGAEKPPDSSGHDVRDGDP